jgi:serine/threonine-protein kinase HipA
MTSDRECFVYIVPPGHTEFVTAGRFRLSTTRDGTRVGRFVYRRRYRERADAVALDPVELRLQEGIFETARMGGFFGAIRDAMPDAWGRRVIERNAGVAELDDFDCLLRSADDRAGALGFGLNAEPPAPTYRFNRTLDLERLQNAADAILTDDPDLAGSAGSQVEELLRLGTSMGGARPKAVVENDAALWVAKFSRQDDRWNHPRVEHGLLELGRRCGLAVADSRLTTVAGRDVLLVRRFDRDGEGKRYRRHRMVSALTLLQSDDSTVHRPSWSYLLLADEIRRVSSSPQADLRELFARMCFNAAISNTDDHPRNHAILAKDRDWRLSPAYDLTPTPSVSRERRDLALVCGDHGRYANHQNLLSAHGRFLLDQEEATKVLDDIVTTVREEWHPGLRRAGVTEQDCSRLANAFLYDGFFYEDIA